MKLFKSIVLSLTLLVVSVGAQASGKPSEIFTQQYAVSTFVNAIAHGNVSGLNEVIDQNAKFTILRGKKTLSFNKKEVVDFMAENAAEQNCNVSSSVVQSNDDVAVVRVDMQYDGHTRSNYVTIANEGNEWKITNVYSVFK